MRFGFVAAGCFVLKIDVGAVVSRCIRCIAHMCVRFKEMFSKLILMLYRAALHPQY